MKEAGYDALHIPTKMVHHFIVSIILLFHSCHVQILVAMLSNANSVPFKCSEMFLMAVVPEMRMFWRSHVSIIESSTLYQSTTREKKI